MAIVHFFSGAKYITNLYKLEVARSSLHCWYIQVPNNTKWWEIITFQGCHCIPRLCLSTKTRKKSSIFSYSDNCNNEKLRADCVRMSHFFWLGFQAYSLLAWHEHLALRHKCWWRPRFFWDELTGSCVHCRRLLSSIWKIIPESTARILHARRV